MKNLNALRVTYAQAVHGEEEKQRIIQLLDENRTILGAETREFEQRVTKLFGKKYGVMVNSGSSANLLAFELLDLPEGSEVITPLLTFSTTVSPLIQKKLIPVFTDVEAGKYTINISQVEQLVTKKTKALMIPLLLGNIPDMKALARIAKKYNLFFIDDSCDTLGATFENKPTGSFSDITTTSFYGSHIITAGGGGGMIMVNKKNFWDRAQELRGWGRSSSRMGESEDIKKRFGRKLDGIPYDAKFIFDEIGYNFLPLEMGAAFGNVQLDKLAVFRKSREYNFQYLRKFFERYENFFILPKQNENVKTQWLAFPLVIKDGAPFSRLQLVVFLEKNNIQTRPIFSGNILRQPGFRKTHHKSLKRGYPITEKIMQGGFLIGCHHGFSKQHLEKIEDVFTDFLKRY